MPKQKDAFWKGTALLLVIAIILSLFLFAARSAQGLQPLGAPTGRFGAALQADLVANSLDCTPGILGNSAICTAVAANSGPANAQDVSVAFTVSGRASATGRVVSASAIDLPARASEAVSAEVPLSSGTNYISFAVDAGNLLDEPDEANNKQAQVLTR